MLVETNPTRNRGSGLSRNQSLRSESMFGGYPKFRNDRGVPEICIGVKEFMCVGESPPQDHPHVYINMGEADTILCPYCATRFRFDPRLTPLDADPPDSFFADHNAVDPRTRSCPGTRRTRPRRRPGCTGALKHSGRRRGTGLLARRAVAIMVSCVDSI